MPETNTQTSYQQSLVAAGLTADQAVIYEFLLKNGPQQAGKLAIRTPLKRGLVYKLLEQLVEMGLVGKKDEPGKVAMFEPAHPVKLKELAEKKEEQAKNAQLALEGVLQSLTLDFNAISGKPGVLFLPGIEGIKKVYALVLERAEPVCIFPSVIDRNRPEVAELINEQIKRQSRLKIPVQSLADAKDPTLTPVVARELLSKGVEIKKLSNFVLPSQIMVFGDNVAITAFGLDFITTYIEHPAIATTLRVIFEQLWQRAEPVLPPVLPASPAPPQLTP